MKSEKIRPTVALTFDLPRSTGRKLLEQASAAKISLDAYLEKLIKADLRAAGAASKGVRHA